MRTFTIFNSRYIIQSHGNGAAYTIFRKRDNESVFIQYGDDASNFRAEFDKAFALANGHSHVDNLCSEYF